ncbi:hypothetical protein JL722_2513 [Aureococcus anophagefferens]|nr:hypothetical protein JL722_2513 [Aureococcus anophagefferens]
MSSLEQPAAPAKHSVLMIAEDLPCGGKTLKATLPAGKACGALGLADEAAALSAVVAAIPAGARVELEWVQLAMPGRPRRVVRQVQKLEALTEAAEAALAKRYPAPRLMMRKEEVAKGAVFELEAAPARRASRRPSACPARRMTSR